MQVCIQKVCVMDWGCSSVGKYIPSMHKALDSTFNNMHTHTNYVSWIVCYHHLESQLLRCPK